MVHIAGVGGDAQDGAGENLLGLGGVMCRKIGAALGLADALDDDLLGGLGGDAAESYWARTSAFTGSHQPGWALGEVLRAASREISVAGVRHVVDDGPLLDHGHDSFCEVSASASSAGTRHRW